MAETVGVSQFPRIWDWQGECRIIDETRLSWIVVARHHEKADWVPRVRELRENPKSAVGWIDWRWIRKGGIELVNKKAPGNSWYFSEKALLDAQYISSHRGKIQSSIYFVSNADTLRAVASLIGYKDGSEVSA
jgi:hypothetical protein